MLSRVKITQMTKM